MTSSISIIGASVIVAFVDLPSYLVRGEVFPFRRWIGLLSLARKARIPIMHIYRSPRGAYHPRCRLRPSVREMIVEVETDLLASEILHGTLVRMRRPWVLVGGSGANELVTLSKRSADQLGVALSAIETEARTSRRAEFHSVDIDTAAIILRSIGTRANGQ